jgi:hypothetical protein
MNKQTTAHQQNEGLKKNHIVIGTDAKSTSYNSTSLYDKNVKKFRK